MSETTTPDNLKALHLTPEQEATRQAAATWLTDAVRTYDEEDTQLRAAYMRTAPNRFGGVAVAPSIHRAPEHIRRGTQIDQEIWQAENAEEDDYQARMDEDNVPYTAEDLELDRLEDEARSKAEHIDDLMYGEQDNLDYGLKGTMTLIATGLHPGGDPEDYPADYFMEIAGDYAGLQQAREAAARQEQPDPLRDQMRERFGA